MKVVLTIRDAEDILLQNDQEESEDNVIDSFALEQNLEEFIVSNWDKTIFGPYTIFMMKKELWLDSSTKQD